MGASLLRRLSSCRGEVAAALKTLRWVGQPLTVMNEQLLAECDQTVIADLRLCEQLRNEIEHIMDRLETVTYEDMERLDLYPPNPSDMDDYDDVYVESIECDKSGWVELTIKDSNSDAEILTADLYDYELNELTQLYVFLCKFDEKTEEL